ncbi:MAG: pyridoxamine 5'-phosphate oxidase [Bacteroidetes bacterium]|nr:pyridoxamine 5'-phosphate oxidase [Bacteroidota bacterium]
MEMADLRPDFGKYTFNPQLTPEHPDQLFSIWLQNASDAHLSEFNAMVLSTVNSHNKPSSRIVLLKSVENNRLVFYTHYESRKGKNLAANPNASLLFFWKELEQQVRIEGLVEKLPYDQSNRYFKSRPRESQLSAMASPQSQPNEGIEEIEKRRVAIGQSKQALECPPFWGGYALIPDYYEFWQGGNNRLHRRLSYSLKQNQWVKQQLAP